MGSILPQAETQFFDDNGVPLALGKVYFYIPSTLTPKDTYQNLDGTVLNTNPVSLDAAGRAVIVGFGRYRQILKDALNNTIWDKETADYGAGATTVPTIAALRAVSIATNGQLAIVLGYYAKGDGGGGEFYWDNTSVETDNGGTVIKPTDISGAGRWLRPNPTSSTFLQFGCKRDDPGFDNTSIFTLAIDSTVFLVGDPGVFYGRFAVPAGRSDFTAWGSDFACTIKTPAGPAQSVLTVNDGGGAVPPSISNVHIHGFVCDGNKDNTTPDGGDLNGYGFVFGNSHECTASIIPQNCHLDGAYCGILASDTHMQVVAKNCSNALFVNICDSCRFEVEAEDCDGLVRMFDYNNNNTIVGSGTNIAILGLTMFTQILNKPSTGNIVDLTISGPCTTNVAQIAARQWSNDIRICQRDTTGSGGVRFVGIGSIGALAGPNIITVGGTNYKCIKNHFATADTQPAVGVDWMDVWAVTVDPVPVGGEPYAFWVLGGFYTTSNLAIGNNLTLESYNNARYAFVDEGMDNRVTAISLDDGQVRDNPLVPQNVCFIDGAIRGTYDIKISLTPRVDTVGVIGFQITNDCEDCEVTGFTADPTLVEYVDRGIGTRRHFQCDGSSGSLAVAVEIGPGQFPFGKTLTITGAGTVGNVADPENCDGRVLVIYAKDGFTLAASGADMAIGTDIVLAAGDTTTIVSIDGKWRRA